MRPVNILIVDRDLWRGNWIRNSLKAGDADFLYFEQELESAAELFVRICMDLVLIGDGYCEEMEEQFVHSLNYLNPETLLLYTGKSLDIHELAGDYNQALFKVFINERNQLTILNN